MSAHLVKSGEAMQQAMSCADCLLFIAGLGIAALQTNWLQVDTIGVLLRHAWGLRRMHKPSTACSEEVDRLQLSRVHAPGVAEEAPLLDGLVHSQIRLEAPAGRPQACQGQMAAGCTKMQCCLKVAEGFLHVTGQ